MWGEMKVPGRRNMVWVKKKLETKMQGEHTLLLKSSAIALSRNGNFG